MQHSAGCTSFREVEYGMNTIRIAITAVSLMLLAGCGSAASTTTPRPAVASAVATQPTTNTNSPSAATISARLRTSGLPISSLIVYTATTDPNHLLGRQGEYTSKVAWQDSRAIAAGAGQPSGSGVGAVEYGGGIEVFSTAAAAAQRLAYLKAFQPPFGDGYDYQVGTAILRLSNYLTPAQATAYRLAFLKAAA